MTHRAGGGCAVLGPHDSSAHHWMLIGEYKSPVDRTPIIAIANLASVNHKITGRGVASAVGIYIISATTDPRRLIEEAADASICGSCQFRRSLGGKCYVIPAHGPLAAYDRYRCGEYRPFDIQAFVNRFVRFGEYGDPAFIPLRTLARIARVASGTIGYTHQWAYRDPRYEQYLMASVETEEEAAAAVAHGYRYFRASPTGELGPREFACPASDEQEHRLSCSECVACDGTARGPRRANPVIIMHGSMTGPQPRPKPKAGYVGRGKAHEDPGHWNRKRYTGRGKSSERRPLCKGASCTHSRCRKS
jgi:hypothetical protein